MTPATQQICLNILAGMLSPAQPWDENVAGVYALALDGWEDQVALQTCRWVALNERYRPSPAELRDIALRLAFPAPPWQEVLGEIRRIILRRPPGGNARRLAAADRHPLVQRVVECLGGWDNVGFYRDGALEEAMPRAVGAAVREWRHEQGVPLGLTVGALYGPAQLTPEERAIHPSVGSFIERQQATLAGRALPAPAGREEDFDE